VIDDVPPLQTETSDVGTTMKAPAVIDLPLDVNGGRNLESFAYRITPSVQGDFWQSVIAGGQTFSKEVLIDGTSATAQIQDALFETSPSMEAVEEFKVQTSGMGAEAGRSVGELLVYPHDPQARIAYLVVRYQTHLPYTGGLRLLTVAELVAQESADRREGGEE
jgi:hypothetical protein